MVNGDIKMVIVSEWNQVFCFSLIVPDVYKSVFLFVVTLIYKHRQFTVYSQTTTTKNYILWLEMNNKSSKSCNFENKLDD